MKIAASFVDDQDQILLILGLAALGATTLTIILCRFVEYTIRSNTRLVGLLLRKNIFRFIWRSKNAGGLSKALEGEAASPGKSKNAETN